MPQIIRALLAVLLLAPVAVLTGCGDRNSQADLDPATGKHAPGWLPGGHTVAAQDHGASCTECHGEDLGGGISRVACTNCHLGSERQIHPAQWGAYAYALHSQFVKQNGTASCAVASCHGTDLNGVSGSGPSCSSCHLGGPTSAHPQAWNSDIVSLHAGYGANYQSSACATAVCHGTDLKGVFLSGPACNSCHNNFQ
ncbi:hypothetical protein [Geomesophilobacter sediminis]|uniref:Cytochrome c7-like domain-containing protein n=1 Tax=Geomesophilobacter sediminis TaxID=2798584 RepID=A0A8J7M1F8_9BACT|nr:hypothetical protein [Geomesophilobacter sediminis]MBJ6726923.1 hypothetical protein [Geomesophilobacter sediminis]